MFFVSGLLQFTAGYSGNILKCSCPFYVVLSYGRMATVEIPPLPTVLGQVLQYDHTSEKASAQGMEQLIAPDKAISSDILRVANSTYYGRSGTVKSLKDGVTLLGLKATKNLILFLSTKVMTSALKGATFQKYLNEYPIISALVSKDLAHMLGHKNLEDEVFLAALLRNIGMSILAVNKKDHYSYMIEQAENNKFDLAQLEKSAYKMDHYQAAKDACEAWKLPSEITEAISVKRSSVSNSHDMITKISILATILARQMLDIPLTADDKKAQAGLTSMLGLEGKLDSFLKPEYLEKLQKHPYYQMAVG